MQTHISAQTLAVIVPAGPTYRDNAAANIACPDHSWLYHIQTPQHSPGLQLPNQHLLPYVQRM